MLECQLQRPLPDDLAEALANGVILCQLANQLRPRCVPFIHVPSPAVVSWRPGQEVGVGAGTPGASLLLPLSFLTYPQPKLSALKSRKNVESFLEACRKMGVPEVWGCALGRRAGLSYKGCGILGSARPSAWVLTGVSAPQKEAQPPALLCVPRMPPFPLPACRRGSGPACEGRGGKDGLAAALDVCPLSCPSVLLSLPRLTCARPQISSRAPPRGCGPPWRL